MATIRVDPTDISPDSDPEIFVDQDIPIPESEILQEPVNINIPDDTVYPDVAYQGGTEIPEDSDPGVVKSYTTREYYDDGTWLEINENGDIVGFSEIAEDPQPTSSARGLEGLREQSRMSATDDDNYNLRLDTDWRVKLSLAPDSNAKYLYKSDYPGILAPLRTTDGVIFPYTPKITVNYVASYDGADITHSNYKFFQYKGSSVDSVTITCDFTAQDTFEANYLLAVIHFFRSVTKMFYGLDENPRAGTPPPLCYLSGLGDYQFNGHPLVINSFTYNLPDDVDYIRANVKSDAPAGVNSSQSNNPYGYMYGDTRLVGVGKGGNPNPTKWRYTPENTGGTQTPTYVPTKIQLTINAYPIVSRNAISNHFSVEQYATGQLLLGNQRTLGGKYGGVW